MREPAHSSISKRGRLGEGRPTKRTPEVVAKIAEAIASGLTDREAGLLAGIRHDTMTEWRKDPEFSEAIEKATAERLLTRLERIEAGEQGWQGTAWALEKLYPHRLQDIAASIKANATEHFLGSVVVSTEHAGTCGVSDTMDDGRNGQN